MTPPNTPATRSSFTLRQPGQRSRLEGRVSRGASDIMIFSVVLMIGAVQVATWMLGRSKDSDRLKIL
jgi:hypothetical protein